MNRNDTKTPYVESEPRLPHKRLLALVLALYALAGAIAYQDAHAQQPVPGIYWNPSEPGRGFPFDYQNGVGSITGYIYDEAGNPLWFLAAGMMTEGNTRLQASADVYEGGQCLGCPPQRPVVAGDLGQVDLQFTAADAATLRIDDVVIQIERQNFGFPPAPRGMLGVWQFLSIGSRTDTNSAVYVFEAVSGQPSGTLGGTGVFVDPQARAAGECFDSGDFAGACVVAQFDSGDNIVQAYLYVQRTDRLYGVRLNRSTLEPEAEMVGHHLQTLTAARARSSAMAAVVAADMIDAFSGAVELVDPASVQRLEIGR